MKHEWRADPLVWGHGPERVLPAVAFSISNTVLGSAAKDSNRCRPRALLTARSSSLIAVAGVRVLEPASLVSS